MQILDKDIPAIMQMVYGEAAGSSSEEMKMITQTVINRLRSKRKKEFGRNVQEVLNKGCYAVKNKNKPYQQAVSGEFSDPFSQQAWSNVQEVVNHILSQEDYGNAMFYFTPNEVKKQTEEKTFDFD